MNRIIDTEKASNDIVSDIVKTRKGQVCDIELIEERVVTYYLDILGETIRNVEKKMEKHLDEDNLKVI